MNKSGTLEDYFTPIRDTPKRRRSNSTPPECSKKFLVEEMSPKKIGDFTPDEFAKMIESTMDKKLQNIATKEDIAVMKGSIDMVVEENRRLKEEVAQLKYDTQILKDQVNESRNLLNRNKLIIRGMKVPPGALLIDAVKNLIEVVLKVEHINIVQAFVLGKPTEARPCLILAEFASYRDVMNIYQNVSKLKGTGIVIHDDVTAESRAKRGMLLRIRKHCSALDSSKTMKLRGDTLLVDKRKFSWSGGELVACDGGEGGIAALNGIMGADLSDFFQNIEAEQRVRDHRGAKAASTTRIK